MTMKVYHAVPKVPDVVVTTAAAKLEGPCVLYYYVEEREAAITAEPYTYLWNEVSAVASLAVVEIEFEVSK